MKDVLQRPREKLQSMGAASLSDQELLTIFIGHGTRGRPAPKIAADLLAEFGSLRNLFATSLDRLVSSYGIGLARGVLIKACQEVFERQLQSEVDGRDVMDSPSRVKALVQHRLGGCQQERFCCLYLDHKHRLLSFEEMSRGGIASAQVYPREIVRRALDLNASAAIICHNHPSGVAEPSELDKMLTKKISDVLQTVDVRLLDHLVVGAGEVVSFAERRMLN